MTLSAYHLYRTLTICIELVYNLLSAYHLYRTLENFGENSNWTFHLAGNFSHKRYTFWSIGFFPLLPKRSKFSIPLRELPVLRVPCFLSRKSRQRYFVNGTTQSRSFLTKRKTRPYLFTENFSELSVQMVSALNDLWTDQNFCVINCVIRDKGQQVGWHNPLSRLSSWFYCSTNCDVIFSLLCFRVLVLLCFVIKETPQHYNSTATVSVQDSSP